MKVLLFLIGVGVGASACRTVPPAPTPTLTTTSLTSDQVADELFDAGCIGPDASAALADELKTVGDPWLVCLFEGGTIQVCAAPCSAP